MKTKPPKALVSRADIVKQVNILNTVLASNVSQIDKASICTVIESLLHSIDMYKGYNNLYWLSVGCGAFKDYKQNLESYGFTGKGLERVQDIAEANKEMFIIGPNGAKAKMNGDVAFTHCIEGDYSRTYYT